MPSMSSIWAGTCAENPKLSGTTHNVFGIQVGVSINFPCQEEWQGRLSQTELFYARVDEFWRKEEKYRYLEEGTIRQYRIGSR